MALLLGMITPLGWLERVPSFKERLRDMAERDVANFGLLGYPVLQTVDITIVRGELVPVGEDQVAHLEISREIVRRFNRLYGDVLVEPQPLLSETPLIPGSRRPQDVEVPRQRDRRARRPRHDPREGPLVRHRSRRRSAGATPGARRSARSSRCTGGSRPTTSNGSRPTAARGELGCVDCKTILADHLDRVLPAVPRAPRRAGGRAGPRREGARPRAPSGCAPSRARRSRRCATRCTSHERAGDERERRRRTAGGGLRGRAAGLHRAVPAARRADPRAEGRRVRRARSRRSPTATSRTRRTPRRWNLEEATWFLAICAVLLELKVGRLMPEAHRARRGGPPRAVAGPRCTRGRSSWRPSGKVAVELARRLEDEAGYFARDVGPGPGVLAPVPGPDGDARGRTTSRAARGAAPAAPADPRPLPRDAGPLHGGRRDDGRPGADHGDHRAARRSFRDLVADCEDRIHVVVRFLAILELYREGKVELAQAETFGEIEVEWTG